MMKGIGVTYTQLSLKNNNNFLNTSPQNIFVSI